MFLTVCTVPLVWGQGVEYGYDAAGNRILRKVITLQKKSGSAAAAAGDQPVEVPAPEIYGDLPGERKVVIYPNPTQGMLRIEFRGYGDMAGIRLLLYNVQGRLLWQAGRVEPSGTLDMSAYPAGMYILQMTEGKAKSEWKIIKE